MSDHIVSPGPAVTLASGTPAGAGEIVQPDPKDAHDVRLIASGRLVAILEKQKPTRPQLLERAKELDIKGRTNMNVDELAAAVAAGENPAQAEKE